MAVISVNGLSKHFGELRAVDGIDLEIEEGEIFGLLGPNGAGKTTTIRILCGLSRPSAGHATVLGHDTHLESKTVRRLMGTVPQGNVLDRELTVFQNLAYHAKLHDIPRSEYDGRIREVLGLIGMADRVDSAPLTLSGGMKRRVTLAKALLHDPKILVLDEPTTGLDPQSRLTVWERIRCLKEEGITVLLTTHYMEEADSLCDRLAIIDQGKIVAFGEPGELKRRHSKGDVFEVECSSRLGLDGMAELGLAEEIEESHGRARFVSVNKVKAMAYLMERHEGQITNINVRSPTLEDVFLEITGRHLREQTCEKGGAHMKVGGL